jgi:hypothetical protein
MTLILMSAQRVSEDGGHFSLSWGLHPWNTHSFGMPLRMRTNFGRI